MPNFKFIPHCSAIQKQLLKTALLLAVLTVPFYSGSAAADPIEEPLADLPTESSPPSSIGFSGQLPLLRTVQIKSDHVYDYTFSKAPTDWWVQSGKWTMTNRWTCAPNWSWFGGRSEEIAALWHKRKFTGDFSFQFYFAFKQSRSTGAVRWPEKQSDMALSFCGDGKNLGSGYTFIIGANDNLQTELNKQGQVVAHSTSPEAIFDWPLESGGTPYNYWQAVATKWWYAKVTKTGNHIECWLDNKLILSYDDPQPFDSGQFALWTYNNAILLSRVQIFYEQEVKRSALQAKVGTPTEDTLQQ